MTDVVTENMDMINDNSLKIVNLSNKTLDNAELSLLSRVLKFYLTQSGDVTDIPIDMFKFVRMLKLKDYFSQQSAMPSGQVAQSVTSGQTISDICDVQLLLSIEDNIEPDMISLLTDRDIQQNSADNSGLKPRSKFILVTNYHPNIDVFYDGVSTRLHE